MTPRSIGVTAPIIIGEPSTQAMPAAATTCPATELNGPNIQDGARVAADLPHEAIPVHSGRPDVLTIAHVMQFRAVQLPNTGVSVV